MKRVLLVLAFLLPLVPVFAQAIPGREQAPNDHSEYRRFVLPNGMRVILLSDPDFNVSSAAMSVAAGSLDDPAERQGLAHFLEHMLFLGTEKYPDASEYSNYLQSNGGYSNAYTQEDNTNYHFEIRHEAFEGAIDRFAQFFIAPLFTPEFTEREMNAVNSEFQRNFENDAWRLNQVEAALYREDHPANHFSIGNDLTLEGTTQEELQAFYRAHYSANRMTLALVGSDSLDQLETWARTYFSPVENRNLPETRFDPDFLPPVPALRVVRIEPLTELRQLSLTFPLPATRPYVLSKPGELLGYILGYEGEGSLLSGLKAEGLATALGAGVWEATGDYGAFSFTISLTAEGLDNYQRVLELVFAAIDDLRDSEYPAYLFSERRTLAELDERYQDQGEGWSRADTLANLIREYPLEIAERIPYLWVDEDPDAYRMILGQLRPDNLLVQISAPGVRTDRVEPYFGTAYSYTEDAGAAYTALLDPPAAPQIHLPDPNPYIPQDTALLPIRPVQLIDEPALSLYYLQDDRFERPQVAGIYRFRLPRDRSTLRDSVLLTFYQACVNEAFNETNYTAAMAGLSVGLSADLEGVQLTVGGYSESADRLLSTALGSLVDFDLSEERFAAIKDNLVRGLRNFSLGEAWEIILETRRSVIREFHYRPQEQLPVAESITLQDVRDFARSLYARGRIEALVAGNVTPEQAEATAREVVGAIGLSPVPDADLLRRRLLDQPAGTALQLNEDYAVNNSAYRQEYMLPGNGAETRAATLVLANLISEPFYSELRTRQQLGYIVSGYAGNELNTYFAYFIVQSGEYPADALQSRSELVISQLPSLLRQLPDEAWSFLVDGARAALEEEDKTVAQRASRLFQLAYDFDADWSRRQDTLRALEQLTPERLGEILSQTLNPTTWRKRTFLGYARTHDNSGAPTPNIIDRDAWKAGQTYR